MEIKDLKDISYMDFSDELIKEDLEKMDGLIKGLNSGDIDIQLLQDCIDEVEGDKDEKEKTHQALKMMLRKGKHKSKKTKKKKDSNMKTVHRFDTFTSPEFMVEPFTRNAEGYLHGRAIVTNTGVFQYFDEEGNERWEARFPEEVFARDTIESLKLKALTDTHPSEAVTVDNTKELQVGMTGSNPSIPATFFDGSPGNPEFMGWERDGGKLPVSDNYHQAIDMTITNEDAIKGILGGNIAISCGYSVEIEETSGVYLGVHYDAIQRNIRYNHVAVNIERARAGDAAKIQLKLDSKNAFSIDMNKDKTKKQKEVKMENNDVKLVPINLDGLEYQAQAEVVKSCNDSKIKIDAQEKKIVQLKKDNSTLEGEKETLTSEVEKLKEDNEELEKSIPSRADVLSSDRSHALSLGEKHGVEVKKDGGEYKTADELSNNDIKKQLIIKADPKADEQIKSKEDECSKDKKDGKSSFDSYLNARLEGALPILEEMTKNDEDNKKKVSDSNNNNDGKDAKVDLDDVDGARQRYVDSLENAHKTKEEKK